MLASLPNPNRFSSTAKHPRSDRQRTRQRPHQYSHNNKDRPVVSPIRARAGRLDDVRVIVGERADAARADGFAARIEALAQDGAPRAARAREPRPAPKGPPAQGVLF